MNIRKPIDYSAMFTALDTLMAADLPQMELYCEIGRLVSGRPEKGAAVAAAEYLCGAYPDVSGFSPRNLRRMREFYRTYESVPEVLADAMTIGWTQNVVILEAELTPQEQAWDIKAAGQFGWSKLELQRRITNKAHLEIVLDFIEKVCYTEAKNDITEYTSNDKAPLYLPWEYMQESDGGVCNEGSGEESEAGEGFPDCLRCHQHRGDWTPTLSSGTPQAGRAWDTVRWTQRPPTDQSGLRRVRPPDWNGSGKPPQYVPYMRRGLRRQDAPPVGLYRPPRRCSRPVVHGRLRGDLAGCAGRLSGASKAAVGK